MGDVAGSAIQNGVDLAAARRGAFGGRIAAASASSLRLSPFENGYSGGQVEVAGDVIVLADIGPGYVECLSGDNTITSTGADSGAVPAADAFHYVYLSSRGASFAPGDLRLSTVAPAATINGAEYLGAAGTNAELWRLCGWVVTSLAGGFEFIQGFGASLAARVHVANRYNRVRTGFRSRPAYVNNGLDEFFIDAANANVHPIRGGTNDFCSYINTGLDDYEIEAQLFSEGYQDHPQTTRRTKSYGLCIGDGSAYGGGGGEDVTINSKVAACIDAPNAGAPGGTDTIASCFVRLTGRVGTAGRRYASLNTLNFSEPANVYGDAARHGSVADMYATYIGGSIFA